MARFPAGFVLLLSFTTAAVAQPAAPTPSPSAMPSTGKPRARELGLSALIGGSPGTLDAITDVGGVEVGHTTLVSGDGPLVVGKGPVRTGVTVVHPRGKGSPDPVFGAWFTLNGNGEMTGTTWLEESGILEGPVGITNTHSVGVVRDAILQWQVTRPGLQGGEVLEPLSITETYIVPPPGTYYIRFILEEIEQGGPRRFLLAHSATAETWAAPPQRVCLKFKKGKCKKWGTR